MTTDDNDDNNNDDDDDDDDADVSYWASALSSLYLVDLS